MSLRDTAESRAADGFPRVSGDEPTAVLGRGLTYQFSPRERG